MWDSGRLRLWAILAPLLIVAALGIRDFAGAFFDQRKLGEAAFEAAKWGKANGYDATRLTAVGEAATTLHAIKVSPSRPCGCPAGAVIARAQCDTSCAQDVWSQPYIIVTASMCYKPAIDWPGLSYCRSGDTQCVAVGCGTDEVVLSAQSVTLQ